MQEGTPRIQLVLTAGAVLAVIVATQAVAGAGDESTSRATATQQIKALKKQVRQLKQRVGSLENQGATPRGPAGGDLGGDYPSPVIAPDAVTSSRIFDGTVSPTDLAQPVVQTPTLADCEGTTDWSTGVAFAQPVRYWKDGFGVVHLQGSLGCTGNATEGAAIFNLPAGYKPQGGVGGGVVRFMALGSGVTPVQLGILSDGSGAVVYDGPNSTAVDDYISLDGITFRAGG
jgi:hypothetical protein